MVCSSRWDFLRKFFCTSFVALVSFAYSSGGNDILWMVGGHADTPAKSFFSPAGQWIVTGSGDSTVKLWDANTFQLVRTLQGLGETVMSVEISPDERYVAAAAGSVHPYVGTSTSGSWVVVWDAQSGEIVWSRNFFYSPGTTASIRSMSFSPDGRYLLISHVGQPQLMLVDTATWTVPWALNLPSYYDAVGVAGDQTHFVGFLRNNPVHLRSLSNGAFVQEMGPGVFPEFDNRFAFTPNRMAYVIAAPGFTSARFVRIPDGATEREITTGGYITSASVSGDGSLLAVAQEQLTVQMPVGIWDIASGRPLGTFSNTDANYRNVNLSPDGTKLLIQGWFPDYPIKIWDVASRQFLSNLGNAARGTDLALSPNGKLLATFATFFQPATGPTSYRLQLRDALTGEVVRKSALFSGIPLGICFSHDGQHIATLIGSGVAQLFNVSDLSLVGAHFTQNHYGRGGIQFASGDRWVVTGDLYLKGDVHFPHLRFSNIPQLETERVLFKEVRSEVPDPFYPEFGFGASEDGRYLGLGGWDRAVTYWQSGGHAKTVSVPEINQVTAIAFSPDNRLIAIAGRPGWIVIFNVADSQRLSRIDLRFLSIDSLCFSRDGRYLASGGFSNPQIDIWHSQTGIRVGFARNEVGAGISKMVLSPDGSTLYTARDGTLVARSTPFPN